MSAPDDAGSAQGILFLVGLVVFLGALAPGAIAVIFCIIAVCAVLNGIVKWAQSIEQKNVAAVGKGIGISVLIVVGGVAAWLACQGLFKLGSAVLSWRGGVVGVMIAMIAIVAAILAIIFGTTSLAEKKRERDATSAPVANEPNPEDDFLWRQTGGEIMIVGTRARVDSVRVPSTIAGLPVSSLGDGNWNNGVPIGVFADLDAITKVALPSSVRRVGNYAFAGCDGLRRVDAPGVEEIGYGAFYGCGALQSVALPGSLRVLRGGAFCKCSSLTSVAAPESVTEIERSTFEDARSLRRVKLPSRLTTIGENAFRGCDNLSSIDFPASLKSIGKDAFSDCGALLAVALPNGLTSLGRRAFAGCFSLRSVSIPPSLKEIGTEAFCSCECLPRVKIPGTTTTIGVRAFSGCSALSSVELSEGLDRIDAGAFLECPRLRRVALPRSVTRIEKNSFAPWTELSVRLGSYAEVWCRANGRPFTLRTDSTSKPTDLADSGARALTPRPSEELGRLVARAGEPTTYYLNSAADVPEYFEIPATMTGRRVERVGEAAFLDALNLVSVKIPDGVKTIENHAFCGCGYLENASIPGSVTAIGARAFADCPRLTSLLVPPSVTRVGVRAFPKTTCLQVFSGSYAERWCREKNQPFKVVARRV